jgi:uncharacterized protein (DUF1330 family)
MANGYWITFYRSISDDAALARYAGLAGPVIQAHGGRILARGNPAQTYEAGVSQRVVVIEFDSVKRAKETYESPAYQTALAHLMGHAERDVRFVEGV